MKEYSKTPKNVSGNSERQPKAANQAPASEVLQAYKDRIVRNATPQMYNNVIQRVKFIGIPSAVHIHAEGNPYHVKFGSAQSTRFNFDPNNADQIQEAYEYTRDNLFGAGREACLEWFLKHGAVNEAQSESESDSDDNRDDSKKYDKWNGYMKTDRYGIPINPD